MTPAERDRLRLAEEALQYPIEMYRSWLSVQGNPIVIANMDRLSPAYHYYRRFLEPYNVT